MLSAAKVRIHGMQDENWVIKDKINQYRGLIKLYGTMLIDRYYYILNFLIYSCSGFKAMLEVVPGSYF